jgi:hypothetical protein
MLPLFGGKYFNKENPSAKRGLQAGKLAGRYDRSAMCGPAPIPQISKANVLEFAVAIPSQKLPITSNLP